ncbi:non-hydrolyzing UDP-N-acetylglucosamine 2-epimerase [Leeuwenhoekiella sp. A2]|uniref:non-hydrolyzing UDP-N-acetylglucosamine 2-epimerase n=1 Tax=Leeuwenhoekiella sp. A2 TaxID=3141460 RepID=UPI003A80E71F
MKNILVCLGTRPEAIKMAPVLLELKRKNLPHKLCITAQHRELLDPVLNFFSLKVDYDLNLMQADQSLNGLSAAILKEIDGVLTKEKPALVFVHGDTTTSVMVAIAAFHRGCQVGHVEAGLRTYDKQNPFPEELNRQLTARIADFHFAPGERALKNLKQEGVSRALVTGNTVIDALKIALNKIEKGYTSKPIENLKKQIDFSKKIILVTGHRRENFGAGFSNICKALLEIAGQKNAELIYPVHLNPNVQGPVYKMLLNQPGIHLIDPLDYPDFIWLMAKADLIISDSGGIQEEAPSLGIPVLVTRTATERVESLKTGRSYLVGTNTGQIVKKTIAILSQGSKLTKENPYGDGKAAVRIVDFLETLIAN